MGIFMHVFTKLNICITKSKNLRQIIVQVKKTDIEKDSVLHSQILCF